MNWSGLFARDLSQPYTDGAIVAAWFRLCANRALFDELRERFRSQQKGR